MCVGGGVCGWDMWPRTCRTVPSDLHFVVRALCGAKHSPNGASDLQVGLLWDRGHVAEDMPNSSVGPALWSSCFLGCQASAECCVGPAGGPSVGPRTCGRGHAELFRRTCIVWFFRSVVPNTRRGHAELFRRTCILWFFRFVVPNTRRGHAELFRRTCIVWFFGRIPESLTWLVMRALLLPRGGKGFLGRIPESLRSAGSPALSKSK